MALNIVTKKTGDLLSATEFNAVVQAINDNSTSIDTLNTNNTNMSKTVEEVRKTQNTQQADIKTLKADSVKMKDLTEEEYQALVDAGSVDADTYYNILEE